MADRKKTYEELYGWPTTVGDAQSRAGRYPINFVEEIRKNPKIAGSVGIDTRTNRPAIVLRSNRNVGDIGDTIRHEAVHALLLDRGLETLLDKIQSPEREKMDGSMRDYLSRFLPHIAPESRDLVVKYGTSEPLAYAIENRATSSAKFDPKVKEKYLEQVFSLLKKNHARDLTEILKQIMARANAQRRMLGYDD